MARPIHRHRPQPSGQSELIDELRRFAEREHFMACATRTATPASTVPPGEDPQDWRLYVNTGSRPLIDAIMRLGIWVPRPGGA